MGAVTDFPRRTLAGRRSKPAESRASLSRLSRPRVRSGSEAPAIAALGRPEQYAGLSAGQEPAGTASSCTRSVSSPKVQTTLRKRAPRFHPGVKGRRIIDASMKGLT
ncbi:hypothetical protein GCM10010228_58700 [Streptomyces massasporeus]|nr:hypothetical protein GCM10010228_58700 [Streptomyces massasporeus]